MFDFRDIIKKVGAALAVSFGPAWAAIATAAAGLKVDFAAGKQAATAAIATGIAGAAALAWGLLKQLWDRAKGVMAPEVDELIGKADAVLEKAKELRKALD